MINRTRIGVLIALAAAAVLAVGPVTGAAGSQHRLKWTGATSDSPERALSFVTKSGKRPSKVVAWGMSVSALSCEGSSEYLPDSSQWQTIPGVLATAVGSTVNPTDPNMITGYKSSLRVRKGRFSNHEVFTKHYYGQPRVVDYTLTGRFKGARKATGTVNLTVVWSLYDGAQITCSSGPRTWSACAPKGKKNPPCAGRLLQGYD